MIRPVSFCALSFVTVLAFGAPPPDSGTDLQPVTVTGSPPAPPVRLDIRTACPAIDATLQRSLAVAYAREQKTAAMRVEFQVDGNRVTQVSLRGAPWAYRQDIRTAVSRLDCVTSAAQPQRFAFALVFADDTEPSGSQPRYALVQK